MWLGEQYRDGGKTEWKSINWLRNRRWTFQSFFFSYLIFTIVWIHEVLRWGHTIKRQIHILKFRCIKNVVSSDKGDGVIKAFKRITRSAMKAFVESDKETVIDDGILSYGVFS